jgi:hypothetical protein
VFPLYEISFIDCDISLETALNFGKISWIVTTKNFMLIPFFLGEGGGCNNALQI